VTTAEMAPEGGGPPPHPVMIAKLGPTLWLRPMGRK
jgi:hypothetical protein